MFDNLSQRLGRVLDNLRGQARLTDDNIRDTMREVRMALLEADVALPVVREFVDRVRERAHPVDCSNDSSRDRSPANVFIPCKRPK